MGAWDTLDRLDKELPERVKREIPGFEIRWKSESWTQRLLAKALFFVPGYMTRFTTVMFGKMYLPEVARGSDFSVGMTLAHEFVHLWDAKKDKLFAVKYLFPQILALGAFGAFWNLWCLLFLLFLLPWPAYWRMKYELRGYTAQLALAAWNPMCADDLFQTRYWVMGQFLGGAYYWMWPFKEDILRRIDAQLDRLNDGTLLRESDGEPYRVTRDIVFDQR